MAQGIYEVWAEGEGWEEFIVNLKQRRGKMNASCREAKDSWKILVDSCFHSLTHTEQLEYINALSFLDFKVMYSNKF